MGVVGARLLLLLLPPLLFLLLLLRLVALTLSRRLLPQCGCWVNRHSTPWLCCCCRRMSSCVALQCTNYTVSLSLLLLLLLLPLPLLPAHLSQHPLSLWQDALLPNLSFCLMLQVGA